MGYKNPKELLVAATALPVAIEAKLPEGAPKISQTVLDMAEKLPVAPDFPMELPDLPAIPTLPEGPAGLGMLGNGRQLVTRVTVTPVGAAPVGAVAPAVPAARRIGRTRFLF